MKACIDVAYHEDYAVAACLLFPNWGDDKPVEEIVTRINEIEPYVPGLFYRRELPCILAVLEKVEVPLEVIVVDSYVWLDETQKPGLGGHLYEALHYKTDVIGVAKTPFLAAPAVELKRAGAKRPLYITAAGMLNEEAATAIARMHGSYRLPTLLKQVDQLCRQTVLL